MTTPAHRRSVDAGPGAAVAAGSVANRAARCRLLPLTSPIQGTCAGTRHRPLGGMRVRSVHGRISTVSRRPRDRARNTLSAGRACGHGRGGLSKGDMVVITGDDREDAHGIDAVPAPAPLRRRLPATGRRRPGTSGPGRALRGDSIVQRGRPSPGHRHFGPATSRTRIRDPTPAISWATPPRGPDRRPAPPARPRCQRGTPRRTNDVDTDQRRRTPETAWAALLTSTRHKREPRAGVFVLLLYRVTMQLPCLAGCGPSVAGATGIKIHPWRGAGRPG